MILQFSPEHRPELLQSPELFPFSHNICKISLVYIPPFSKNGIFVMNSDVLHNKPMSIILPEKSWPLKVLLFPKSMAIFNVKNRLSPIIKWIWRVNFRNYTYKKNKNHPFRSFFTLKIAILFGNKSTLSGQLFSGKIMG